MKRHIHMLDLDSPSHPRLRKSACKACKEREAELTRLRAQEEQWNADSLSFGQMSRELARLREELVAQTNRAVAMNDETARLREELEQTQRQDTTNGRGEYVAMGTFQRMAEEKLLLKAELARLREENDRLKSMDLHSSCHKREDRLRENYDAAVGEAEAQAAEVARLREAWQRLIDIAGESETGTMYAATVIECARNALKETT